VPAAKQARGTLIHGHQRSIVPLRFYVAAVLCRCSSSLSSGNPAALRQNSAPSSPSFFFPRGKAFLCVSVPLWLSFFCPSVASPLNCKLSTVDSRPPPPGHRSPATVHRPPFPTPVHRNAQHRNANFIDAKIRAQYRALRLNRKRKELYGSVEKAPLAD
jgi:hypothetical protein